MDPTSERKGTKIGVKEGEGPPPGYKWSVDILDSAHTEAMSFLTEDQYGHLARQVRELARQDDPTRSDTVDVKSIGEFFEIRDKGGILQKINARVFFCVCKSARVLAVLGAINKK